MKINKHIEIVRSNKSWLSSLSQRSCDAIFAVLEMNYSKVGVTIIDNLEDLEALALKQPDLVFLGMKFILDGTNSIWLSTYLDERGITYTGSTQPAHFLEHNKATAKQRILDVGLATSAFCVIKQADQSVGDKINLNFPLFVKPLNRGGGAGIDSASVVRSYHQLNAKVRAIGLDLGSDSLIEQYLPGREFTVAILKDETGADFSVMSLQLIAPKTNGIRMLSNKVKNADSELAAPVTDLAIKSRIEELALNVFYALGARDYGRIDIRLSEDGTPHFLEANLIPSLISGYGSFPKACVMNIGLAYEPMILRIVRLALKRNLNLEADIKPAVGIPVLAT